MARTAARLTIADVSISNPDKVLYPAAGFTKADAVRHYVTISRFVQPHLDFTAALPRRRTHTTRPRRTSERRAIA